MEQNKTGQYIMQKRKEKNMTQEELAEKLSVSNKTVSKWENGEKHAGLWSCRRALQSTWHQCW